MPTVSHTLLQLHICLQGSSPQPVRPPQVKRIVREGKVAPNRAGAPDAGWADTIGAVDGDGLRYAGPRGPVATRRVPQPSFVR